MAQTARVRLPGSQVAYGYAAMANSLSGALLSLLKLASAILIVSLFFPNAAHSQDVLTKGTFKGEIVLKDLNKVPEYSTFELMEDFTYTDPRGISWTAPRGTIVDGASIPKVFWSVIGGPWSGQYKRASVIHDHFCPTKSRDWRAVHKVFYEAMITSGVSDALAKVMYYAVYRFGPRWTDTEKFFSICIGAQRT